MTRTKATLTATIAILIFVAFTFVASTFAQQFTYPVVELGVCRDQRECRLYCQIPDNFEDCTAFGKKHNVGSVLGEETDNDRALQAGIIFPVAELGNCDSVAACKEYCSNSDNVEVCRAHAKRFGLKYEMQANRQALLDRLQEALGCTDRETCRQVCAQEENRKQCRDLAKSLGLKKSRFGKGRKTQFLKRASEVLGCETVSTCKQMCRLEENHDKCREFGKKHKPKRLKLRSPMSEEN